VSGQGLEYGRLDSVPRDQERLAAALGQEIAHVPPQQRRRSALSDILIPRRPQERYRVTVSHDYESLALGRAGQTDAGLPPKRTTGDDLFHVGDRTTAATGISSELCVLFSVLPRAAPWEIGFESCSLSRARSARRLR
jgi:hypothetical protein